MCQKINLRKLLIFSLYASICLGFTLISAAAGFSMSSEASVSGIQLVLSLLMLAAWGIAAFLAWRSNRRDVLMFCTVFWCYAAAGYLILCILTGFDRELSTGMRIFTAILEIPVSGYFSLIAVLGIEKRAACIILTLLPAVLYAGLGIHLLLHPAAVPEYAPAAEEPAPHHRHKKRKKRKREKRHG